LEERYNCVLCQVNVEEAIEHLFFDYPFAVARWFALGFLWDVDSNIHHKLYLAKQQFNQQVFMEIFMIGAWTIWNDRNDYIFTHRPTCFALWKTSFKAEVREHFIRIKRDPHHPINLCLNAL
jgi:hypothetical protein